MQNTNDKKTLQYGSIGISLWSYIMLFPSKPVPIEFHHAPPLLKPIWATKLFLDHCCNNSRLVSSVATLGSYLFQETFEVDSGVLEEPNLENKHNICNQVLCYHLSELFAKITNNWYCQKGEKYRFKL